MRDKIKEKERQKKYYEEHKEQIKLRQKNYKKEHREVARRYYKNHKEQISDSNKKYYEEHKDQIRKYQINNKEQIKEKESLRRKNNLSFKISKNLRNRLFKVVKYKYASALDLVGCSVEDLMKHLESQFQEGMTWDNYGKWHIDHIKPCASFNLLNEEEQRQCFHYSNLQPLWAVDNLKKGRKTF